VRQQLTQAGCMYDPHVRAGVIPHLLDCLAIDGRMGYTAIGRSREEVTALEDRVATTLQG
jgi:PGM1 C-terminal domain